MSSTFGKFKESKYSSDYIKNKRNKEILCNYSSDCIKNKRNEEILCNNKKCKVSGGASCDIYPFNKRDLTVNLYSRLDLQNVKTICKGTNICDNSSMSTNIAITDVPLYQYYIIDPNGSLFGNSECGANNYTEYIVPDI